jgi:hypothetical protein
MMMMMMMDTNDNEFWVGWLRLKEAETSNTLHNRNTKTKTPIPWWWDGRIVGVSFLCWSARNLSNGPALHDSTAIS